MVNSRTGQAERLGKMLTICGKKQTDAAAIPAGDIGAVAKLTTAKTGDTLCDPARVVKLPAPTYPIASYQMAVRVAKKGDRGQGLRRAGPPDRGGPGHHLCRQP